jgi:serine protease AprX
LAEISIGRSAVGSAPDRLAVVAALVLSALIGATLVQPPSTPSRHRDLSVLVHEANPASRLAEDLVHAIGGRVTRPLPLIDGFAASVPDDRLSMLATDPSIVGLSVDGRIEMASSGTDAYDVLDPNLAWRKAIRLGQVPDGIDGSGVTVAMIDTGVAHHQDLDGRVVARVDFTPGGAGDDQFGHGTHLAGVIAGDGSGSLGKWRGVAPGAQIVSVKVAGADGSTDVSVVIAALQWVIAHEDQYGIRVLNLSFGTDSIQPYAIDPLDAAVERAWAAGITVVVSAGNRGPGIGTIAKPGDDPFVITVGAADLNQTSERWDDEVAPFSSRGPTQDGFEKPDLVAPGTTIVSTRDAGSAVDQLHPDAVVDDEYFKGTGTSQSGAIVSGVAALMYEANPSLSPRRVKGILMGTAFRTAAYRVGGGEGLVDATGAVLAATSDVANPNAGLIRSTGLGTLEGSRGRFHVETDLNGDGQPDLVQGEIDVLGDPWDSTSWSSTSWSSTSWSSTSWSSLIAENGGWASTSWSSTSWSGMAWSSTSWSSNSWGSSSWSSNSWSSNSWSSNTWSSNTWSSVAWS